MNTAAKDGAMKDGDYFILNGEIKKCIGTDQGLIWYETDEPMGSECADPLDCQRLMSQDEVYNQQKLERYH